MTDKLAEILGEAIGALDIFNSLGFHPTRLCVVCCSMHYDGVEGIVHEDTCIIKRGRLLLAAVEVLK